MTSEWKIPKTHAGTEWVTGLTAVPGLDPSTESATDPNQQVLFNNVSIFDGLNDGLKLRQNVLVQGNKIKTISDAPIQVGAEATVIDGGGRTLMPGLIDCHVHLTIAENYGTIESDFT